MRRAFSTLLMIVVALTGVRLIWACLDVTPIVVVRDASIDPDASCLLCVQQPENCLDVIADCQGNPRCKPAFECIVRDSCLDLPTLDDKIKCGLPCAQEAGIETIDDPVISTHLVALVACGQSKCAVPCNLQDATTLGL
jgi:hypothetical protein